MESITLTLAGFSEVQQRGVTATKQILECMIDGLTLQPDEKIMVCELLPNRLESATM